MCITLLIGDIHRFFAAKRPNHEGKISMLLMPGCVFVQPLFAVFVQLNRARTTLVVQILIFIFIPNVQLLVY